MNGTIFRCCLLLPLPLLTLLASSLVPGPAFAQSFSFVSSTSVTPSPNGFGLGGIARVGDEWFIANLNGGIWNVYDLSFNFVRHTFVFGTSDTKALVYNPATGTVFLGDNQTNTIYEVSTAGTVLNSFGSNYVTGGLTALAYDPNTNTLFALHFDGQVERLMTDGTPISNFFRGGSFTGWSGAAFDARRNTLLLMESGVEIIWEYTPDGTYLGTPLVSDAVQGTGQGLHFDSITGVLTVTSQQGNIAVWQRPLPVSVHMSIQAETWGLTKSRFRTR